jgi:hypothetical protein
MTASVLLVLEGRVLSMTSLHSRTHGPLINRLWARPHSTAQGHGLPRAVIVLAGHNLGEDAVFYCSEPRGRSQWNKRKRDLATDLITYTSPSPWVPGEETFTTTPVTDPFESASQMAPYSLYSSLLLTRAPCALVKSNAQRV